MYSITFSTNVTNNKFNLLERYFYSLLNWYHLYHHIINILKVYDIDGWNLVRLTGGYQGYLETAYELRICNDDVSMYTIQAVAESLGIIFKQDCVLVGTYSFKHSFKTIRNGSLPL